MWNIMCKPLEAIGEAKNEKNIGKTLLVLLVGVVLFGISLFFFARSVAGSMFLAAIVVAILLYALMLVGAYLLKIILHIFAGEGDYFSALTPMAYSFLIFSAGVLVASILILIPTFVGPFLAFLVMLWALATSGPVLFKATMELFNVDVLTVIVAYGLLSFALGIAVNIALANQMLSYISSMGSIIPPML